MEARLGQLFPRLDVLLPGVGYLAKSTHAVGSPDGTPTAKSAVAGYTATR